MLLYRRKLRANNVSFRIFKKLDFLSVIGAEASRKTAVAKTVRVLMAKTQSESLEAIKYLTFA